MKNRIHKEWFRSITKTKCDCGASIKKDKEISHTSIYSWGNYVRGKWRTISIICIRCAPTKLFEALKSHSNGCGCNFVAIGYGGEYLPLFITSQFEKLNKVA